MDKQKLKAFKQYITRHQNDLLQLVNMSDKDKNMFLHGAEMDDVLKVMDDFKDALIKLKNDTFGNCIYCSGEVEEERLEQDFTQCVCLDHYSTDQIRNLERDLELAVKVQKDLLPCCVPENTSLNISFFSKPARIVSGDYYDFFNLANGIQGIVIADVMGKGLPASMLMASIQASLRSIGPENEDVGTIIGRLNELFCYNMKMIKFISLCIIAIDEKNGVIHYANAGHNPPVFWSNKSQQVQWLMPTGPAIGVLKNIQYNTVSIAFKRDDLLLLYTDGLTEAMDSNEQEFGDQMLAEYITANHMKSVNGLVSGLRQKVIKYADKIDDDLTMIAVKK